MHTLTATSCRLVGGRRAAQNWRFEPHFRQEIEDVHGFIQACERMKERRARPRPVKIPVKEPKLVAPPVTPQREVVVVEANDRLLRRALLRQVFGVWREQCEKLRLRPQVTRKANVQRWKLMRTFFLAWYAALQERRMMRDLLRRWAKEAHSIRACHMVALETLFQALLKSLLRTALEKWNAFVARSRDRELSLQNLRQKWMVWRKFVHDAQEERRQAASMMYQIIYKGVLRRAFVRWILFSPHKVRERRPPCDYVRENFRAFETPPSTKTQYIVRPPTNLSFHDTPSEILKMRLHDSFGLLERPQFLSARLSSASQHFYELWHEDEIILTNSFRKDRTPRARNPHRESSSFWI